MDGSIRTKIEESLLLKAQRALKMRACLAWMDRLVHDAEFSDGCNAIGCPRCKEIALRTAQIEAEWETLQKSQS